MQRLNSIRNRCALPGSMPSGMPRTLSLRRPGPLLSGNNLLFRASRSVFRQHSQHSQGGGLLVEQLQMAGEGLEAVAQHARQLARRLGRAAGESAHLVDLALEFVQALCGIGPFGDEGGQRAFPLAEVFRRVARRQVAPGIEIES